MKLQCLKLLWGIVSTLEYSVFYRVENIFVWPFEKVQMAKVLFFNLGAVWVSEIISKRGAYHTHSWGPQNRSTSENEKCPRKLIKKFDKKHFISINFFLCLNQNWFSSLWIYNPHSRPNPTFKSGKSIKIIDPWSFFYHHSDNLTWNNGHSLRRNFSPDLLLPLLKMKSKRFRVTKYTMV